MERLVRLPKVAMHLAVAPRLRFERIARGKRTPTACPAKSQNLLQSANIYMIEKADTHSYGNLGFRRVAALHEQGAAPSIISIGFVKTYRISRVIRV